MNSRRILYSVLFYVSVMSLLVVWKPSMMFDKDGNPRKYGVERGETIFSLGVFSVVIAFVCYYLFAMIDYIFSN